MDDARALSSRQATKRTTPGGQSRYSNLTIEIALTLGRVFGPRLRQTEGFVMWVLNLMGLDLAVPDHTTLSRRARKSRLLKRRRDNHGYARENGPVHVLIDSTRLQVYGAGHWLEEKHSIKLRCALLNRMLACGRSKSVRCNLIAEWTAHQRRKSALSPIDAPRPHEVGPKLRIS
ncbi:hypothetical protein GXW80_09760 (plasmid) [Rhizobium tropici]|uniref:Transposase DDE domain-containing protein n=1 Tax=Rhizobium tropici TaxID=398 RepID=A0A6P1C4C4_RHITR|nr:hypothetical protein [Rhizobium tropici]